VTKFKIGKGSPTLKKPLIDTFMLESCAGDLWRN